MIQRPGRIALLLAGLVCAFLLAPLLAVVPISFTPARFLTMPNGNLSLVHYRELIGNPDWAKRVAEKEWEPRRPPLTIAELEERGLSKTFAGYMKNWKGFVAE